MQTAIRVKNISNICFLRNLTFTWKNRFAILIEDNKYNQFQPNLLKTTLSLWKFSYTSNFSWRNFYFETTLFFASGCNWIEDTQCISHKWILISKLAVFHQWDLVKFIVVLCMARRAAYTTYLPGCIKTVR